MIGSKPVSRRSFLQAVLNGVGGASMISLAIPPDMLPAPSRKLDKLDQASFASRVKSSFRVFYTRSRSVTMSLVAVNDLRTSPDQKGEVFSLLFETTARQALTQGTYVFQHKKLGTLSMFIVPASSDGKSHRYEALFNRP